LEPAISADAVNRPLRQGISFLVRVLFFKKMTEKLFSPNRLAGIAALAPKLFNLKFERFKFFQKILTKWVYLIYRFSDNYSFERELF